jgi:hypothetical protein
VEELMGDFQGHPFRGNQHKAAGRGTPERAARARSLRGQRHLERAAKAYDAAALEAQKQGRYREVESAQAALRAKLSGAIAKAHARLTAVRVEPRDKGGPESVNPDLEHLARENKIPAAIPPGGLTPGGRLSGPGTGPGAAWVTLSDPSRGISKTLKKDYIHEPETPAEAAARVTKVKAERKAEALQTLAAGKGVVAEAARKRIGKTQLQREADKALVDAARRNNPDVDPYVKLPGETLKQSRSRQDRLNRDRTSEARRQLKARDAEIDLHNYRVTHQRTAASGFRADAKEQKLIDKVRKARR